MSTDTPNNDGNGSASGDSMDNKGIGGGSIRFYGSLDDVSYNASCKNGYSGGNYIINSTNNSTKHNTNTNDNKARKTKDNSTVHWIILTIIKRVLVFYCEILSLKTVCNI